ncbi:MAG: TsaB protein, required for threonylcarbamoyladenosine (t(6)A) formation in tRNA [uncultured Campylobacterales bacterium]|uniref:TsaB protein, required for threonylcarbamoyladenosine (T(6)A) formation in tRNA n=1 Tax=uncultured Campylobacterales bacterium TaxID=352960 RepID=A0A6S6SQP2_9BACT|nr:MAG: TsaB protein, required for threonylcarbamoyladenosine (t(6)A) formation in tRNA [uncultured Campylobacterales bacterium]
MDIVICSTLGNTKVGLYDSDTLISELELEGKVSDTLPSIFGKLNNENINNIYFAKGPGSFMAIKLTYVFLKTISIIKKINLFAVDSFYFNQNSPIKAIGNSYFVKDENEIKLQVIECSDTNNIELPQKLIKSDFSNDISPLYIIPAVGI